MKFVSQNWHWETKDYLDQFLHVLMGASLTLVVLISAFIFPRIQPFVWFIIPPMAALTLAFCAWREWRQHPGRFINLDFMFIILGTSVAVSFGGILF